MKRLAESLAGIAHPSWISSVLAEQPAPPPPPPPDEETPPEEAPPEEEQPPEPPIGGTQADPGEAPIEPTRPFQNDGLDKLDVNGTPKPSPTRYRQPGPGDEESIKRFLKKNPKATDDDLHSFLRTLGIDPQEGEKTVMKLARASESVLPASARVLMDIFLVERRDVLPGGMGDKLSEKDVDPEQLRMGIEVELEHTKSRKIAKEIALDHLAEDPNYYTKLRKVHKEGREIDSEGRISCGVFLPLPSDLARQFPIKRGNDDSVPHVTVLYVGNLSAGDYADMIKVVQRAAADYKPFYLDMLGVGVFSGKENDIVYAPVGSRTLCASKSGLLPTLHALHVGLGDALKAAGIKVEHDYGQAPGVGPVERFIPHITLARIPKGSTSVVKPPSGSWLVTDIECWGFERVQLRLGRLTVDQPH